MSSLLGRPSTTTTSELGASTVPGRSCTLPCASVCEYASSEILSLVLAHSGQPGEVKTTGVGGAQRGYDGGKKVKGRKRHLLVDTEGLVLKAKVHTAQKCWTRRGSRRCSMVLRSCFRAFLTCGWTLVIGAKRKAEAGCRRSWGGAWTSLKTPAQSRSRRSSEVVGRAVGDKRVWR